MIKLMATEFMCMLMAQDTKECGRMIFKTVAARKVGLTDPFTLVNIWQERSTAEVFTVGMTVANTMVNGLKTK
jgi:hypothetical protein